jgi:hypothetical protein
MGNHPANGFYRKILSPVLEPKYQMNIPDNSCYIAGATAWHVYLGNSKKPYNLFISNFLFKDTLTINLLFSSHLQAESTSQFIDSPVLYLSDYNSGLQIMGTLTKKKFQFDKIDSFSFIDEIPLSPNSIILRTLNSQRTLYILSKISRTPYQNITSFLLKKQTEGLFSTDGMLAIDKTNQAVIYTYYYRNQFISLDTNLNLRYVGRTIDTNNYAKIKVGIIKSDKSLTLSSPPLIVNRKSCVCNGILFIQSALKADNDDKTIFNRSSVLDLYSLNNGKYKGSVYLRNSNETKLIDFKVCGNKIIALFDGYICLFEINPALVS